MPLPKSKMTITLEHLAEKLADYWHELEKRGASGTTFRDLQKLIEFFELVDAVEEKLRGLPQMKRYRVKLTTEAGYEVVASNKHMAQQLALNAREDGPRRAGIIQTSGTLVQATALSRPTKFPNRRKTLENKRGRSKRGKAAQA